MIEIRAGKLSHFLWYKWVFVILIEHFPNKWAEFFRAKAQSGSTQKTDLLDAYIARMVQQKIQIFPQLHVRIQIDSTVLIDDLQPSIVRNKRPYAGFVGRFRKGMRLDIEIRFIPFPDLVIRAHLFPRLDAFSDASRQRLSAKPTVMDRLWYHQVFSFLWDALSMQ